MSSRQTFRERLGLHRRTPYQGALCGDGGTESPLSEGEEVEQKQDLEQERESPRPRKGLTLGAGTISAARDRNPLITAFRERNHEKRTQSTGLHSTSGCRLGCADLAWRPEHAADLRGGRQ